MKTDIKVICPACGWEPDGFVYWCCDCGHSWNTFDTAGECPACRKTWESTQCPCCTELSLHTSWYQGLDNIIRSLVLESLGPHETW